MQAALGVCSEYMGQSSATPVECADDVSENVRMKGANFRMVSSIRFLRNEAGKAEGLAYAGFETFKGSPYPSCARETGQNSRDAANGNGPVKVTFDLRKMPREEVPFADELEHAIQCCLDEPQDEKTEAHLRRALATISAPVIKILEISDYNTTGLTGPTDDAMSIFTALVKGTA
jgi:hypothetical protein